MDEDNNLQRQILVKDRITKGGQLDQQIDAAFLANKEITSLLQELQQEVCSLRNKVMELRTTVSYQQNQIYILQLQKTTDGFSLFSKLDAKFMTFKA